MKAALTQIKAYSQSVLADDRTGHDYLHAQQVANLALKLYQQDHGTGSLTDSEQVILLGAAYLHDTIDDKVVADVAASMEMVASLLQEVGLSLLIQAEIADIITHMSYSANLRQRYQLSQLGQYVQDADRLAALGAIGIARAFAFGGQHQRKLYDPASKPVLLTDKAQYRQHEGTTINHFYEKLLHLAPLLNTPAGQQEGQRRTAYMKDFLREFDLETGALSDPAFALDDEKRP
ncbi:HD domain-containing protein [Leuconostocaceae bacterium ESL0958]|nr:HD domain-containing protein [Leuconostocaceae bacterium ESL0958]